MERSTRVRNLLCLNRSTAGCSIMGLFEEVMQMMERKKKPPQTAQPIGYQTPQVPPATMVDPMQDPRLQQEMIRDPALEQRIRQFMLEQMRQRQFNQGNASLGTRG